MAVTLKDIAERTGVSPSVVSTVLSGRDNGTFVSEGTRQKVLQVAELLHYTPVRSGRPRGSRRLRRQRTECFIGVWDPTFSPATAFYLHSLQDALAQFARQEDMTAEDDFGLRLLAESDLPRLDALGIMGIVLLTPAPLPREAAAASIPCVMIGETDNPPRDLVQVHMDNFAAGREVGLYLWSLGHRRIAFLTSQTYPRVTRQRFQGLQAAWAVSKGDMSHVLPAPFDTVPLPTEREQIRRTVIGISGPGASATRPTALVCANETVAAIAGQTLAELGLRVPQDVSLAAFHDTPGLAEAMTPPLTTMRRPLSQIAEATIASLHLLHDEEPDGEAAPRDIAFPGELIVRASCASPTSS